MGNHQNTAERELVKHMEPVGHPKLDSAGGSERLSE